MKFTVNTNAIYEGKEHTVSETIELTFDIIGKGSEWYWVLEGYGQEGKILGDTFKTEEEATESAKAYTNAWGEVRSYDMRLESKRYCI